MTGLAAALRAAVTCRAMADNLTTPEIAIRIANSLKEISMWPGGWFFLK